MYLYTFKAKYLYVCCKACIRAVLSALLLFTPYKNSEYDQEIPQSQTADNPTAPQGRAAQPSQDTKRQTKQGNPIKMIALLEWT